MSFQSFSKLTPNKNKPKNLPTPQFIHLLNQLTQNTNNHYDTRTHVLVIHNLPAFQKNLAEVSRRSFQSFERQLKIIGFKKQREVLFERKSEQSEQTQRTIIKYYWRGKKQQYIAKELDFLEKHLTEHIAKVTEYRHSLIQQKEYTDKGLEDIIFVSLAHKGRDLKPCIRRGVEQSKKVINWAHGLTGEMVKDMQINLDNEISLLRLLAYRQNEGSQE